MNANWKYLVTKNNNRIIFGIDSAFARSCLVIVLMGASLFAAPVAARKTANKPSDDVKVFFPQQPRPDSMDDAYKTMLALARGRLVLKNGCLRLEEGKESFLLIWPGRYGLEVKNRTLIIKDVYAGYEPEVRIKLNSEVILTGGGVPDGYVPDASTLVRPLPKGCKGPYWSVGGIELVPKSKRR
jgi:hypothetical protein